jgi:hypothetical protein
LPEVPEEDEIETHKSRSMLIAKLAREENLTVRQLLGKLGGGRGHRTFTGTPEQLADDLQDWFENGAADGFNVMPPAYPKDLETFTDHVVPILQKRRLFRAEYEGTTLRRTTGRSVRATGSQQIGRRSQPDVACMDFGDVPPPHLRELGGSKPQGF